MKQAIVYSSKTGNTKVLAQTIAACIPTQELCYMGEVDETALQADRLFIGFWTDKGTCHEELLPFLQQLHHKEVFLFGSAGFGGQQSYFDRILTNVKANIPEDNIYIGTYMCQGKMQISLRERYIHMACEDDKLKGMVENFDKASSHPDVQDLQVLCEMIQVL